MFFERYEASLRNNQLSGHQLVWESEASVAGAIVMWQTVIPDQSEPRTGRPLPRPRDVMMRAFAAEEADSIYLDAYRQVDATSPTGRVYLADLAEALGMTPIRWRALQRMAEKAAPG